ncbi:MAG: ABC transporter ATP-binding protein [Clostridia bacterium]|nr:MAG: ABC transporter ATP-binding protein [Clostridia bacterium]
MEKDPVVPHYWHRRNEVLPSFYNYCHEKGKVCLEARKLTLRFGGITALDGVSFHVQQGEIHAIVGPNGAGKSSLLNCISGLYRPQQGEILVRGQDLVGLSPDKISMLGLGRTFQRLALFKGMTVLENIFVGRHSFIRAGLLAGAFYWGKGVREDIRNQAMVEEIIEFLEIEHLRNVPVGELSYGLQKRVELGRALALEPAVLLLDEPVAGMNLEEKEDMARFILDVKEDLGLAVVLIEHELDMVMDISDRVTVMNFGRVIGEGQPAQVVQIPEVVAAYVGAEGQRPA